MIEPVFTRDGDTFVPTQQAIGPWDPGQLHGGPVAALVAQHFADLEPDKQLARVTYEFLGPVPRTPLRVEAEVVKPGGRLALMAGTVHADGRPVLTATATMLRRGEIDVPLLGRWDKPVPAPGPAHSGHSRQDPDAPTLFHTRGMTIRFADGTGFDHPGPAQGWFCLERDLVQGEPLCRAARAVAAADFGNGASRVLDWDHWLFVNCDLTVTLLRDPSTDWVLLDSTTRIDATGVGWASSVLYDETGPIGFSQQTLFVAPR